VADELAVQVNVRPGQVIVDVGTGTGYLAEVLRSREPGASYIGLDGALAMLCRGQGCRLCGDLSRLPLVALFWVALGGCMIHAVVDFPFQIESILVLFTLLCSTLSTLSKSR